MSAKATEVTSPPPLKSKKKSSYGTGNEQAAEAIHFEK